MFSCYFFYSFFISLTRSFLIIHFFFSSFRYSPQFIFVSSFFGYSCYFLIFFSCIFFLLYSHHHSLRILLVILFFSFPIFCCLCSCHDVFVNSHSHFLLPICPLLLLFSNPAIVIIPNTSTVLLWIPDFFHQRSSSSFVYVMLLPLTHYHRCRCYLFFVILVILYFESH